MFGSFNDENNEYDDAGLDGTQGYNTGDDNGGDNGADEISDAFGGVAQTATECIKTDDGGVIAAALNIADSILEGSKRNGDDDLGDDTQEGIETISSLKTVEVRNPVPVKVGALEPFVDVNVNGTGNGETSPKKYITDEATDKHNQLLAAFLDEQRPSGPRPVRGVTERLLRQNNDVTRYLDKTREERRAVLDDRRVEALKEQDVIQTNPESAGDRRVPSTERIGIEKERRTAKVSGSNSKSGNTLGKPKVVSPVSERASGSKNRNQRVGDKQLLTNGDAESLSSVSPGKPNGSKVRNQKDTLPRGRTKSLTSRLEGDGPWYYDVPSGNEIDQNVKWSGITKEQKEMGYSQFMKSHPGTKGDGKSAKNGSVKVIGDKVRQGSTGRSEAVKTVGRDNRALMTDSGINGSDDHVDNIRLYSHEKRD